MCPGDELGSALTAASSAGATPIMDRLISRTVEKHRPLSVHFDLTYRCNERCVHCYLDHDDHGELTTVEVKSVLDQLAADDKANHAISRDDPANDKTLSPFFCSPVDK